MTPSDNILELNNLRQENVLLRRLAFTDSLTGLANRAAVQHDFVPRWTRENCGAIILFDLDRFKSVNDTHGHIVGDQVLAEFGAVIARTVRATDLAARLGGEEFVVLVVGALEDEALAVADRILSATEEATFPKEIRITASAGVAAGLPPNWNVLLKRADDALYEAKRDGRNCVRVARRDASRFTAADAA